MSDLSDGFRGFRTLGAEARPGMKIRFLPSSIGIESDKIDAVGLETNKVYVVGGVEVEDFVTRITLEEKDGWFNSIFFVPV